MFVLVFLPGKREREGERERCDLLLVGLLKEFIRSALYLVEQDVSM